MNKLKLVISIMLCSGAVFGQKLDVKETWVSGYARSVLYTDSYDNTTEADTVSANQLNSGHTLVDLAVNIKPSDKVFIHGMVRVRNDHGGFWGSGVTLDLRNLYLRGLVGRGFRYQLGDINYKLTPYTMFNSEEELSFHEPKVFSLFREMNRYDLFFNDDNSWRQQGVTGEFGLRFKKGIEEMDFTLFTTRLNATANNGLLDRLQSGGSVFLKQSKYLDFRATYINAYDVLGTSSSVDRFSNPVLTGGIGLHAAKGSWNFDLSSEFGQSNLDWIKGTRTADRSDHFSDVSIKIGHENQRLKFNVAFQDVGTGFRSIGAQTKRLDFDRGPLAFNRYGNEQSLRAFGLLDIMRDASIYNTELSETLMPFDPAYGNAQPYGVATPNRRNLSLGILWEDSKKQVELDGKAIMGSEIVGQGTEALRGFMTLDAEARFNLNNLIRSNKRFAVTAGFWSESTSRSGEADYENVQLDNSMIDLGIEYEFIKDFEVLAGLRMLSSVGNESLARRNTVDDIITFETYEIDMRQNILGFGLRYNFSEDALLNVQATAFDYTDDLNVASDYDLSNIAIIYRMKF